jgi:hypothetical protein
LWKRNGLGDTHTHHNRDDEWKSFRTISRVVVCSVCVIGVVVAASMA